MTSLFTGASRKVPATLRLSRSTTTRRGNPGLRWRSVRNPVARGLLWLLLAIAQPLTTWQRRMRDRDSLQRLPDYLLEDIGLNAVDARREAEKPFWRP